MKTIISAVMMTALLISLSSCHKDEMAEIDQMKQEPKPIGQDAGEIRERGDLSGAQPVTADFLSVYSHDRTVKLKATWIGGSEAAMLLAGADKKVHEIYTYGTELSQFAFLPVVSGVKSNPKGLTLWKEVRVVFGPGVNPQQFTSEHLILEASKKATPDVKLLYTGAVYKGAALDELFKAKETD